MAGNNKEKNRRLKLGIVALVLIVLSYAIAKITNDVSGDWWKFSLLATGIIGWTEGCITLTDIFGLKDKLFAKVIS